MSGSLSPGAGKFYRMADEIQGETGREEKKKEVQEEGTEDSGERENYGPSSSASLRSDFCEPEGGPPEVPGEGFWVCEAVEGGAEYYGGEDRLMSEEFRSEEGEEEMEELTEEGRISLDSKYLKSVLGVPLTYALLDIATKRPTDPIQYLGAYLLKWRWCGTGKGEYEEQMKALDLERDAYKQRIREIERQEMLAKEQEEEELRRAEKEESSRTDEELEGEAKEEGLDGG